MSAEEQPQPLEDKFQIKDPAVVFKEFSDQELPRVRETDPEFEGGVFDDAVRLVLQKLAESGRGGR